MPTEISGSTGVNKIQDDTVVAADIASSVPLGKVLQIVQTSGTSQTSVQQSYTAVTGGSVTITPSATSSKVFVSFSCGGFTEGSTEELVLRIKRGSTVIRQMARYTYSNQSGYGFAPVNIEFLDSPSTTSATTYTIEAQAGTGYWQINSQGGTHSLFNKAMEIGA